MMTLRCSARKCHRNGGNLVFCTYVNVETRSGQELKGTKVANSYFWGVKWPRGYLCISLLTEQNVWYLAARRGEMWKS